MSVERAQVRITLGTLSDMMCNSLECRNGQISQAKCSQLIAGGTLHRHRRLRSVLRFHIGIATTILTEDRYSMRQEIYSPIVNNALLIHDLCNARAFSK